MSVIVAHAGELQRRDYALDQWSEPPEGAIGVWQGRLPEKDARRNPESEAETLLDLFEALEGEPEAADLRYVLGLLLVRRRLARLEDETDEETLMLDCPVRETTYRVTVAEPTPERQREIEQKLAELLGSE